MVRLGFLIYLFILVFGGWGCIVKCLSLLREVFLRVVCLDIGLLVRE